MLSIHPQVAWRHRRNKLKPWLGVVVLALVVPGLVSAKDLSKTRAKVSEIKGQDRPLDTYDPNRAEIERKRKKMIVFTVGERKKLVSRHLKRAIALTLPLYRRTKDPNLKYKLSLKLGKLYFDQARARVVVKEAAYEKQLARFERSAKRKGAKPPPPPSHRESRALEEKAIGVLKTALSLGNRPDLDEPLFYLGLIYASRGELEKAQPYYSRILSQFPNSRFRWQAKLMVAEGYFDKGQFNTALRFYEELIAAKPHEPYPKYKKAWTLFNLQRHESSIALFYKLFNQARSQARRGKTGELQDIGRQIVGDLVVIFADSRMIREGIKFFDRLSPSSRSYKSLHRMARLLNKNGDYKESRHVCEHIFRRYASQPIVPLVIMTYVDTFIEYVHDTRRYHGQVVRVVRQKLSTFPPAQMTRRIPGAKDTYRELERFIVKQAKNLHAAIQKLEAKAGKVKDKRQQAKIKATTQSALAYYKLYATHFFTWRYAKFGLDMSFYEGELLFQEKKMNAAADAYIRAIRLRSRARTHQEKKMVKDAIFGAVVAYDQLLGLKETKGKKAKGLKPIPFKTLATRFLKVANLYLRELKGHSAYGQISYRGAKVYYDHNRFKEAIPWFWKTIQVNPRSKLAGYSADLILDSYNALKDYEGLIQAGNQLLATSRLSGGAKQKREIKGIIRKARFKLVEQMEDRKDFMGAAKAYLALGQDKFNELGDAALHNAAVNFIKVKRWDQAVAAYGQLVKRFPKSKYKKEALLTRGEYFQYLGDFKRSQKAYMAYLSQFPSKTDAYINVGYQVAFVAQVLGDHQQALTYYQKYLALRPRARDRDHVVRALCQIGGRMGGRSINRVYSRYGRSSSRRTKTYCEFQREKHRFGRGKRGTAQLLRRLRPGFKDAVPVQERQALAPYFDAQVTSLDRAYRRKSLSKASAQESGGLLQKKLQVVKQMDGLVSTISDFGVISSLFLALKTLAETYIDLSDDILAAPIPPGLSGADQKTYRREIEKIAAPLKRKGIDGLKNVLQMAGKLRIADKALAPIWRQYEMALGRPANIPPWLRNIELMPFYLPTTKVGHRLNSFFPPVLFERFTVARSATALPNLSRADVKTRSYYEILALIGRGDFQQAWSKLMPLLSGDLKNAYLLNVLAYLKAQSGYPQVARLILKLAQKALEGPKHKALRLVLNINEALVWFKLKEPYTAVDVLSQAQKQHAYAGLMLGFFALKYFNFVWARSVFYDVAKMRLLGTDKSWLTLGKSLGRWGTRDPAGALSDIKTLENETNRSVLVVSLPLEIALLIQTQPNQVERAQELVERYGDLRDTNQHRVRWVKELGAKIRGLASKK